MEQVLIAEIVKAIGQGDWPRFITYVAIFFLIWVQLRSLKKEVKNLNTTIALTFKQGDDRFTKIEDRLTVLESYTPINLRGV